MKQAKWGLLALAFVVATALGQSVYNYFPPPGITYTETGGLSLGAASGGGQGAGTLNAEALYINGVPVGGATGSVSSVSVVSANGLSGTVATPTTTPAITLAPTFTGIAYSTGSALQAAVAGNFPTLNQNTTGNAATATLAATATAAATTPTTCAAGQAAKGVDANFNALGCITPYSVVNESANTLFAGPTSGTAALPAFRALVPADLPLSSPLTFTGANVMQPGSGVALTINGATGSDALDINNSDNHYATIAGSSTTGASYGLDVVAGTNSSDVAFRVGNRSGTLIFRILGDGTTTVMDSAGGGPYQVGYLGTPLQQPGGSYTLALADRGKSVEMGGPNGSVLTIPSGVFSAGDVVTIIANGPTAGYHYSISPAAGVTLYWAIGNVTIGARTLTTVGEATIICVASNVFIISGSGIS